MALLEPPDDRLRMYACARLCFPETNANWLINADLTVELSEEKEAFLSCRVLSLSVSLSNHNPREKWSFVRKTRTLCLQDPTMKASAKK
jgi:hypothetical protein